MCGASGLVSAAATDWVLASELLQEFWCDSKTCRHAVGQACFSEVHCKFSCSQDCSVHCCGIAARLHVQFRMRCRYVQTTHLSRVLSLEQDRSELYIAVSVCV